MKNKILIILILVVLFLLSTFTTILILYYVEKENNVIDNTSVAKKDYDDNLVNNVIKNDNKDNGQNKTIAKKEINEWELTLVNQDHSLPEDFSPALSSIDSTRKFDSRAIKYLNEMFADMKKQGVSGIWVQSSYRSVEAQKQVFDKQVAEYMKTRKN